jgi:hypothetical protein
VAVGAGLALSAGCESDTPPAADTPDAGELTVSEFNDLSLPQQYDVIEVFVQDHPGECGGISDPTGEDLRDDVRNRAIGSEDSRNAGDVILVVCAEY